MSEQMLNKIFEKLVSMDTELREIKTTQNQVVNRLDKLEEGQAKLEQGQIKLEQGQAKLEQSLLRIEQDHGTKIAALFDGYTLRGEQLEGLKEHFDERLDSIQNDLSYAVGKVAQHDRNILQLTKQAR